jgi:hypothetical protein
LKLSLLLTKKITYQSFRKLATTKGMPASIIELFVKKTEGDKARQQLSAAGFAQDINEISADPNADTDKTAESLGIPSAEAFAAMIGAPIGTYASAADGSTVSDAGVLGGVPAPNMGRASSGVAAGFGGLGSTWRTALGLPVVDGQGNPILTSQGAAQRAYNESPQGEADAMRAEISSLQNRYPSGGGGGGGGGDGGGGVATGGRDTGGGARDASGGGDRGTRGGFAQGGLSAMANPYDLGSYSDGGRLLRGPGDGVSDSIPATIGKGRPARLADGEFVIPARIVSEIGNGSTEAGARKLYAMMDRIQAGRKKSVGKGKVAVNSRADKHLPA